MQNCGITRLISGIIEGVFRLGLTFFGRRAVLLVSAAVRLSEFSAGANGAEVARLRISIPGLGSSSYPLIMAQKKGYFRAEGYDVELIPMAAGLAVKTLMAGGDILTMRDALVAPP